MSAPIMRCVSILFSGVKVCRLPSMWDEKVHPSGVILRLWASENTWKPPLSVSIGPFQAVKRCKPPAARRISSPGRRYR